MSRALPGAGMSLCAGDGSVGLEAEMVKTVLFGNVTSERELCDVVLRKKRKREITLCIGSQACQGQGLNCGIA